LLLDKSTALLFAGLMGYFVSGFRSSIHFFLVPLVLLLVAGFGAMFLSYGRMLDPLISLALAGNALLAWEIARLLSRRRVSNAL
jgi:hypothetical protein